MDKNLAIDLRVAKHYEEGQKLLSNGQAAVGIWLQGSQNYNLDTENSDVDTKLIVAPSLREVAKNSAPISTTHVRANDEHIDLKDVRLYIQLFRKQNLNFTEILFTEHRILNPLFAEYWKMLETNREQIARLNPYRAVNSMYGVASEKHFALEHKYPSKLGLIEKYGYDGKQLSHLIRIDDFLAKYINDVPYTECMIPTGEVKDLILKAKAQGQFSLEEAREMSEFYYNKVHDTANRFCKETEDREDLTILKLLEEVQYQIIKVSIYSDVVAF